MTMRSQRGPNVTPDEHRLVVRFTGQCLREICKKQYELAFEGKPLVHAEARKHILVRTKHRGQRSYGGGRGICIDIGRYRAGKTSFAEYPSFQNDPVIGGIENCDGRELPLKCMVAHEVAHHIACRYGPHTRYLKSSWRKPHGDAFKTIYRQLRRTLVNPCLTERVEVFS